VVTYKHIAEVTQVPENTFVLLKTVVTAHCYFLSSLETY